MLHSPIIIASHPLLICFCLCFGLVVSFVQEIQIQA
jgi:hypothetical protein